MGKKIGKGIILVMVGGLIMVLSGIYERRSTGVRLGIALGAQMVSFGCGIIIGARGSKRGETW
jgi:hypothetical protein